MTLPEVAVGSPIVSAGVTCHTVDPGLVTERSRPSVA